MDVKRWKPFLGKKLINAGGSRTNLLPPSIFGAVLAVRLFDNYTLSLSLLLYLASWSICKKDISLLIWPSTLAAWDPPQSPALSYTPRLPPPSWFAIQVLTGFCTPQDLGPATGQRHPGIYKLLIESEVLPLPLETTSVQEFRTQVSGSQCVGSSFACTV